MEDYTTVNEMFETSLEIKKSKFIARLYPLTDEGEAEAVIAAVKKEHYKANHVCSAWVLGGVPEKQKANDDGEPSGTAGKPILEVIHGRELKNVLILVIRYFGGIKLGAGGLIRAYSGAAAAVVDAAQLVRKQFSQDLEISIEYPAYGTLSYVLAENNHTPYREDFDDKVHLFFYLPMAEREAFTKLVRETTADRFEQTDHGQIYVDILL